MAEASARLQEGVGGNGRPREERAKFWKELNQEWRSSGLSQAEFCRQKRVSVSVFRWWRYHRLLTTPRQRTAATFLPVRIIQPEGASQACRAGLPPRQALEIVLRGGRVVRIGGDFDPALLGKLLAVLDAGVSC